MEVQDTELISVIKSGVICETCGKEFANVYTLNAHIKQIHEGIKSYQCSICGMKFSTKYKTLRHFQGIHSDKRDFHCDFKNCKGSFKTRDMLTKHQRTHFTGPFKCELCNEVIEFKFKSGLDYHIQQKHVNKSEKKTRTVTIFKCSYCDKEFRSLQAFETHELTHGNSVETGMCLEVQSDEPIKKTAQGDLECKYCFKRYKTKQNYVIHLALHENSKDLEDFEFIVDNEEHLIEEAVDDPEEDLFKNIDEGLVSIVKIETKRYVDESEDIESTNVDQTIQPSEELLDSEHFLTYDETVDYLVEHEDELDLYKTTITDELENELDESEETNQVPSSNICFSVKPQKLDPIDKSCLCEECGKGFQARSNMKRHFNRQHRKENNKFECDLCGSRFLLNYDLKRHMIKHSTSRSFDCKICDLKFKTAYTLKNHVVVVHTTDKLERKFQCKVCSRSYFHQRHLRAHETKHTGDARYSCDLCSPEQHFFYSDAIKWHKIRHHGQPAPFNCTNCTKRFIHKKSLQTHEKEHQQASGSLAVDCPICGKKVSEKRHLKRHMRGHDDKKFHCKCGDSFKERYQLSK